MKNLIFIMVAVFFASCGGGDSVTVDQTKPESILKAVFASANSGNYEVLKDLCDPNNDGDGDTKRICKLASKEVNAKFEGEFKKYFAKGKITGTPQITGDKCTLDFTFGPNGTKKETMKFVKRGDKWYLYSF